MDDRISTGKRGEEIALRHLEKNGYHILERRFRTRFGEIDLIADEGGDLVFVEVKTRTGPLFGSPEEAVDQRKQRRLIRLASAYLQKRRWEDRSCRFDVVAVVLIPGEREQIRLFRDAVSVGT
ncbi:MAG: YraN family protein [Acidobacteria bacterium]|nr:YraN family protein [Acidobacteriota bacterium]